MFFFKRNHYFIRLFEESFFILFAFLFLCLSYSFIFQAAFFALLFFFHFIFYIVFFSRLRISYLSLFFVSLLFDLRFGTFLGFYGFLFLSQFFLCRLIRDLLKDNRAVDLWVFNGFLLFIFYIGHGFIEWPVVPFAILLLKFILGLLAYPFAVTFYYALERVLRRKLEILITYDV